MEIKDDDYKEDNKNYLPLRLNKEEYEETYQLLCLNKKYDSVARGKEEVCLLLGEGALV